MQRTPWSFSNGGDTNSGPLLTPDARFVVFASRENLDGKDGDNLAADVDFDASASSDIFRLDLQNGELTRVSVDRAGNLPPPIPIPPGFFEGQLPDSTSPAITANGRLVAFATDGVFLPEDRNDSGDVYIKDLRTRQLSLVSTSPGSSISPAGGVPITGSTPGATIFLDSVAISGNGRFIAFITSARLDTTRDGNDLLDVYVKDLHTNQYFLASFDDAGEAGGISSEISATPGLFEDSDTLNADVEISADGRIVAFTSSAPLDPADNNDRRDAYIWNRSLPETRPVLASPGAANDIPSRLGLSANGRFVAFSSDDALVPDDMNGVRDVYRFDRKSSDPTRRLILVSLDAGNRQTTEGNFPGFSTEDFALSASGRFVAFSSGAGDLVLNDLNTDDTTDIFVKDLRTGSITRANIGEDGIEPNGFSFLPSLSANGGVIAFLTTDPTLLEAQPEDVDGPGDTVVVTEVNFPRPPADIPGAPPGAASIEVTNFALRSTIDRPGDHDWFRVSLTRGVTYTIDLEGRPSRQGTLDDPLLRILVPKIPGVDQDGLEALDDDGGQGLNARLRYEAHATGVHFISAEGFGNATGTYRLLVREQ